MSRNVLTIFRKELLEVRRDRKTLLVTFFLPCLAFPLLIGGLVRYNEYLLRSRALRTVTLAADEQTRADYLRLSHEWARNSDVGRAFMFPGSPLEGMLKTSGITPPDFSSPEALQNSGREQALDIARAIQQMGRNYVKSRTSATPVPEALLESTTRYYHVVIRGMGLVNFIDPAQLPTPPESFTDDKIPATVRAVPDARRIAWAIQRRRIQGYLVLPPNLDRLASEGDVREEATLIYDSTISLSGEAQGRVRSAIDAWRDRFVLARLNSHNLSPAFVQPIDLKKEMNLASQSKQLLAMVAGMVPYLIIIFAFMGGMATATDLGAGEKERGTLETLLLTPASRGELAFGKFFVIMLVSLSAGLLSVVSLGLSIAFVIPQSAMQMLDVRVNPLHIALMATLALPAAATFAGIFLTLSIYSRSTKEAQSYMAPISFLLLIPGMAAMMPDLEPTRTIAAIPLVNVSLMMREFMKGETWWTEYALTMATSLGAAALCIALAVRLFRREEVLFRS